MIKPDKSTYKTLDRFYGRDYQLIVAVLLSRQYQQVKALQRDFFTALGYPIPKNGFANRLDYIAWQDRIHIHHNPSLPTRTILESFSLDVSNRIFNDLVHHEFYFNVILDDPIFYFIPISNGPHTYIEIFPWTTADHLKDNFSSITRIFLSSFQKFYATIENIDESVPFEYEVVGDQCLIRIFPWTTGNDLKEGFRTIVDSFNEEFCKYRNFKGKRIRALDSFRHQIELYYLYKEYQFSGLKGNDLAIAFTESPAYSAINDKYMMTQDDHFDMTRVKAPQFERLLKPVHFVLPDQTS